MTRLRRSREQLGELPEFRGVQVRRRHRDRNLVTIGATANAFRNGTYLARAGEGQLQRRAAAAPCVGPKRSARFGNGYFPCLWQARVTQIILDTLIVFCCTQELRLRLVGSHFTANAIRHPPPQQYRTSETHFPLEKFFALISSRLHCATSARRSVGS